MSIEPPLITLPLYRLAHSRTGDKGNISNISVIAGKPEYFPLLKAQLTEAALLDWFAFRQPSLIQRSTMESIHALNLVLQDIMDGGVQSAQNQATHGKARDIDLPDS